MPSKWGQIAQQVEPQQEDATQGKWRSLANQLQEHEKTEPQEDMEWGEVALKALKNVPSSGVQFAKDVATPFIHPIDTANAIINMTLGLIEKVPGARYLTPGPAYDLKGKVDPRKEAIDGAIEYFTDRYGSIQGFKKAVSEDPVGVGTDFASVLTGGGAAVKGVGKVSKLKGVEKVGNAISKVGLNLEPYNVAKLPIRAGRKLIPKALPSRLYESATKMSTAIPKEHRIKITNVALDNQIMPTYKGLDKINDSVNAINDKIIGLIDESSATGRVIPIKTLFEDFGNLREQAKLSGKPMQARNAINNIQKQIILANTVIKNNEKAVRKLTPKQTQRLKQNIYKEISSYYSSVANSPASVKAQKAVARRAKVALEELIPEIKGLNRAEGDLLALKKEIDKAATRIANRDILSLGTTAKAAGGGVVAGAPGLAAGLALGILDSQPVIKARLALLLHKMKERGMKVRITPTVARLLSAEIGKQGNNYNEERTPIH